MIESLLLLLSPLCRVFTIIYLKQTLILGYSVAVVLYLQFLLHVMLFRVVNIFRTCTLVRVGIATCYGFDGLGLESRWGEIFRTRSDRPWGPPSLPYSHEGVLISQSFNAVKGNNLCLLWGLWNRSAKRVDKIQKLFWFQRVGAYGYQSNLKMWIPSGVLNVICPQY